MKILAKVGPRGRPIPNPSICSYKFPLKIKTVFRTACCRNCLNKSRVRLRTVEVLENNKFRQISIVSCTGMLVKRDSTSKEAIWYESAFWNSEISRTKQ